jgi:hypothetical protein
MLIMQKARPMGLAFCAVRADFFGPISLPQGNGSGDKKPSWDVK